MAVDGIGIKGFVHARQTFYQLTHMPSPLFQGLNSLPYHSELSREVDARMQVCPYACGDFVCLSGPQVPGYESESDPQVSAGTQLRTAPDAGRCE